MDRMSKILCSDLPRFDGQTLTQGPDDDGVYPCELGPETRGGGRVTRCAILCGVCFACVAGVLGKVRS